MSHLSRQWRGLTRERTSGSEEEEFSSYLIPIRYCWVSSIIASLLWSSAKLKWLALWKKTQGRGQKLACIQLEQQILHKSGACWEFIIPAIMVLPSLVPETEVKKALNVSALSMSLFVRWPFLSSNRQMLSLVLLLLLTYFKRLFLLSSTILANFNSELWLCKFFLYNASSIPVVLPCRLTLFPVAIHFLFLPKL